MELLRLGHVLTQERTVACRMGRTRSEPVPACKVWGTQNKTLVWAPVIGQGVPSLQCPREGLRAHSLSSRNGPEELKAAESAACLFLRKGVEEDVAAWRGFQKNPVKALRRRASEGKT